LFPRRVTSRHVRTTRRERARNWARSEVKEKSLSSAVVFLRAIWREIETWRDRAAVGTLCEESSEEARHFAARLAAQAAFDVALGIVQVLDNEEDIGSRSSCRAGCSSSKTLRADRPDVF
jgi:hypothetical protein